MKEKKYLFPLKSNESQGVMKGHRNNCQLIWLLASKTILTFTPTTRKNKERERKKREQPVLSEVEEE